MMITITTGIFLENDIDYDKMIIMIIMILMQVVNPTVFKSASMSNMSSMSGVSGDSTNSIPARNRLYCLQTNPF